MNKLIIAITAILLALSSCSTYRNSGSGVSVFNPKNSVSVENNWGLVPGKSPIIYTIYISTLEGQQKLNKLTLEEAQTLAVNEAAQKHGAVTIINPTFTQLQKGRRKVLRITVSGIPAYYKNAGYFQNQTQHPNGNSNINVKINQ